MLQQRRPPVESNALRQSARGRDCTLRLAGHCVWRPETVVLAHVYYGPKAMGGKGDDFFACFACSGCHDAIDRYLVTGEERYQALLQGVHETQQQWVYDGLLVVPSAVHANTRSSKTTASTKTLARRGI